MASREGQKVYLKSLKWKRFFHLYLTCLFRVIHCSLHICWHWPHSNVWIAWRNFLFLNWFLSFLPYVPTKWSTMDLWIIVLFFLAVAQLVNTLHFLSTLTSISSRYSASLILHITSTHPDLFRAPVFWCAIPSNAVRKVTSLAIFTDLIYHIKKVFYFFLESKTCSVCLLFYFCFRLLFTSFIQLNSDDYFMKCAHFK